MKTLKLTILGEPMGKQRPKVTVLGSSKFAHAYTPKETINYESKVVDEYRKAVKNKELSGSYFNQSEELSATITAYYPITKGHYRFHKRTGTTDLDNEGIQMLNGIINPTKKPDCDNIAKIILDALNGIAYPDDSQVTCLLVMKRYSESPRVEVTLEAKENTYVKP